MCFALQRTSHKPILTVSLWCAIRIQLQKCVAGTFPVPWHRWRSLCQLNTGCASQKLCNVSSMAQKRTWLAHWVSGKKFKHKTGWRYCAFDKCIAIPPLVSFLPHRLQMGRPNIVSHEREITIVFEDGRRWSIRVDWLRANKSPGPFISRTGLPEQLVCSGAQNFTYHQHSQKPTAGSGSAKKIDEF